MPSAAIVRMLSRSAPARVKACHELTNRENGPNRPSPHRSMRAPQVSQSSATPGPDAAG